MLGFIRTIVFVVGIYYIIRFLMRLFAPDKKQNQQKTTTTTPPPSKKKPVYKDDAGEYVDYEEIKD